MKSNKDNLFIFALSALILLASCSSEQTMVLAPVEKDKPQLTNDEFSFLERYIKKTKTVSPDEAATKVLSQDSEVANTRSSDVNITKIDVLRKENYNLFGDSVFNLLPDTLVYLVNTDDGMCTAVPADYRVKTSVLGKIPQNQVCDMESETDWEIHDILCEMFATTAIAEITEFEASHDSLEKVILEKLDVKNGSLSTRALDDPGFNPNDYEFIVDYGELITNISSCSPLIPYAWKQGAPYNNDVCYNNCSIGNSPVGCVALAAAMIMTYWQHPNNVNGSTVNWSAIRSQNSYLPSDSLLTGAEELAHLLDMIGNGMGMHYSCSVSTTDFIMITSWLTTHGYYCNNPINFSYNLVKTSLDNGWPVVISGFPSSGNIGHAWIIHGYSEIHSQQEKTIYAVHKVTGQRFVYYHGYIYNTTYYLCNNMGDGSATSWINSSNLNSWSFPTYALNSYNNNKKIYTGIRPR